MIAGFKENAVFAADATGEEIAEQIFKNPTIPKCFVALALPNVNEETIRFILNKYPTFVRVLIENMNIPDDFVLQLYREGKILPPDLPHLINNRHLLVNVLQEELVEMNSFAILKALTERDLMPEVAEKLHTKTHGWFKNL